MTGGIGLTVLISIQVHIRPWHSQQAQTYRKTNQYPLGRTRKLIGRSRRLGGPGTLGPLHKSGMAERIRGGKLTVLNPAPPIRRVWLRASQVLSAKSQVSPMPSPRSGFVYHTD
jgi:hypothetical protein